MSGRKMVSVIKHMVMGLILSPKLNGLLQIPLKDQLYLLQGNLLEE